MAGARRGREAAALDAAGAALGSIGMLAFAVTFFLVVKRQTVIAFAAALCAWAIVAFLAWRVWLRLRAYGQPAGTKF